MATAGRVGIPLFLMAIMVGNGANAGSLSPFAPTGIIVNGLMTRNGLSGHELENYLYNLLAHMTVAFGGYFLFGGLKLFGTGARESAVAAVDPADLANPGKSANPAHTANAGNPASSMYNPRPSPPSSASGMRTALVITGP